MRNRAITKAGTGFISISFVLVASLAVLPEQAMAQKPSEAQREDALYVCLRSKFPQTRRSSRDAAFDPQSGRNFAWDKDKQVWIDVKTLQVICGTPAEIEDALYVCLRSKFPQTRRSSPDAAFDPQSGRNFAWDKDKQAWIDTKTLDGVCPEFKASKPTPITGTIDRCLVGTWRSESVALLGREQGGADIVITIKGDGTESVDYNGMKPLKGFVGEINSWAGTATGRISAGKGEAAVKSVERSNVTHKYIDPNGKTSTNPIGALGPGAVGEDSHGGYTCDENTLMFKTTVQTFKFKREKREP